MPSQGNHWLATFDRHGAVWQYEPDGPHAVYDMAPLHSDFYLNTDVIVSKPNLVDRVVTECFLPECAEIQLYADWVLSYSASVSASIVLASCISQHLNCKLAYADIRNSVLNFPIKRTDKVLIVTDDVHSGASVLKLCELLSDKSAVALSPVLTVGNFHNQDTICGLRIVSAVSRHIHTWISEECPLCKSGSLPLNARRNWSILTS